MTRIGVIGAGAIGGSLGGFMALKGEDVTLIDTWRDNVDMMRENGLVLDGSVGEHRVEVNALHTDELDRLSGSFDILIVAVKSYDTKWALDLMSPFIHEDTWVVSPQNSIIELQIAPIVGARRTIGCVTTISVAMMEPARILRSDSVSQSLQGQPIAFRVGELDGRVTPRVEELSRLFEPAGHTVVTQELWSERWTKLATNCMANPTSAVTGLPSYDMKADERSRKMMLKLCVEVVKVGRAVGHDVRVPMADFTLEDMEQASIEGHPELEERFVGEPQKFPGRPSMGQDVIKGRRTEIDYLNGFAAEQGKRIGVPTPYNEATVAVVKGVESGEFPVGIENVARVESMVRAAS